MYLRDKSVRSWCDRSSYRSFMVDPLSYFSFQPVLGADLVRFRFRCNPDRIMFVYKTKT